MKQSRAFIQPSTKEFYREARRTPHFSFFDFFHGYFYSRWPYLYIGVGLGEHPLAKWLGPLVGLIAKLLVKTPTPEVQTRAGPPADALYPSSHTIADVYHGKVVPLEQATRLVKIGQPIRVDDLEQVIPYPTARSIVMQNPDHIVALECPCRSARKEPCQPLDVCLIVGEPFASFVVEHHPKRSRWISQDEAAGILSAEHERGHVHHAFFKDAMLQRFYAICNCCACCCGAMQAHRSGIPMLASSGYVARADPDLCIACGTCEANCQFGAIALADGSSVVNVQACMGCGVCVSHCPQEALTLILDTARGLPLEMKLLAASAPS